MAGVSNEGGGNNQDFDLNLAPIIDCFTVLIAYLMVSASFLSLTIFDVEVAATGNPPAEAAPAVPDKDPPIAINIQILEDQRMVLKLSGGAQNLNISRNLAVGGDAKLDIDNLKTQLENAKTKYAKIGDTNVSAESRVKYREIVRVIEAVKPIFPKVYLSGEKIVLSTLDEK